ncbi:MAG TPA: class IV adenylate cyclase [Gemmataceae bacterium]|nr:class IV adenylate cyclase [Gemmataceae bacterium]
MPTNIELKARIHNASEQLRAVERLAGAPVETFAQIDTFFQVPHGRLKLRQANPGAAELIFYERVDQIGARKSQYSRIPTDHPEALRQALAQAMGILGVVKKTRRLYLLGQTRFHWDEVEGLGNFLEVEVVLRPEQSDHEGVQIAAKLQHQLGIPEDRLIAEAYVDLLSDQYEHEREEL